VRQCKIGHFIPPLLGFTPLYIGYYHVLLLLNNIIIIRQEAENF